MRKQHGYCTPTDFLAVSKYLQCEPNFAVNCDAQIMAESCSENSLGFTRHLRLGGF